jgi:hypothetical protein
LTDPEATAPVEVIAVPHAPTAPPPPPVTPAPVAAGPPADDRRLSPIPLDAILPMVGIVLVLIVVLAWLG